VSGTSSKKPNQDTADSKDVLLAASNSLTEVESFIHDAMAARANELERMGGFIQVIFKRRLNRTDDFWFEVGLQRISLRRIFDSPGEQHDRAGNVFYTVGFNLT